MEGDTADDLDIEVAEAYAPLRYFPHAGEGFGQQVVQLFVLLQPLTELRRLRRQRFVGERGDLLLPVVHLDGDGPELAQLFLVVVAEDLLDES